MLDATTAKGLTGLKKKELYMMGAAALLIVLTILYLLNSLFAVLPLNDCHEKHKADYVMVKDEVCFYRCYKVEEPKRRICMEGLG